MSPATTAAATPIDLRDLKDFLVQLPDLPDALPRRLSTVPAHLAYNKPYVESGELVLTGPTLSSHKNNTSNTTTTVTTTGISAADGRKPDPAPAPLPMTGTVTILKAASEDEVWEYVRKNPFAVEGVWDMQRASVVPFRCAVRVGM